MSIKVYTLFLYIITKYITDCYSTLIHDDLRRIDEECVIQYLNEYIYLFLLVYLTYTRAMFV